jgi:hypothetical protein
MLAPSDITDPVFRQALEEADRFLDDGDFAAASRKCAETYLLLLEKHPDLIPADTAALRPGAYQPSPSGGGTGGALRAFGNARAARGRFWPVTGSIQVLVGEDRKPSLHFSKDRFSFSEAAGYYEFLINEVWRLQQAG